jgi:hypothetical protein
LQAGLQSHHDDTDWDDQKGFQNSFDDSKDDPAGLLRRMSERFRAAQVTQKQIKVVIWEVIRKKMAYISRALAVIFSFQCSTWRALD